MTDKEIIEKIEMAPEDIQNMVAKAFIRNDINNDDIQYTFNNLSIEEMNEPDVVIENVDAEDPEGIGALGFNMRISVPVNNKNYIRRANGGWSPCIKGKPTDPTANVLSNCVGYACGRFNEIINEALDKEGCTYNTLCCNAENWIERAKAAGLEIGQVPRVGAIMCWQRGATLDGKDGAGHVAVVEKVTSNNEVYTSESNYGGTTFFNATRNNNNGRWGLTSSFTFRGFIYLPENVQKIVDESQPTPPSKYPYYAIIKKGSALYTADGRKYRNSVNSNKKVEVLGEKGDRYHIYGETFNPHEVYCDKSAIIGNSPVEDYPFEGIIKKGSYLYTENGKRYPNPARYNRDATVLGEHDGRYKVKCKYFTPNIVYCDKSAVIKK